jgi:hypothetical protein
MGSAAARVAQVRTKAYIRAAACEVSCIGGEFNEQVICYRMRGAADRGTCGRVRDDASAVCGPFARPFRRFVAIGVPAGIARPGNRRCPASCSHRAGLRVRHGTVQARAVYLDCPHP